MVVIVTICMAVTFIVTSRAIDESRNYLYMIRQDGEVMPLEWIERRGNLEVEIKHHISMFVNYFYNINQNNMKENADKALRLGNFQDLYNNRVNRGYFNNTLLDVEYTGEIDLLELIPLGNDHYNFKIIINATTKTGSSEKHTAIFATGKIRPTNREFPHNPHGLFIENYAEERIVNIE